MGELSDLLIAGLVLAPVSYVSTNLDNLLVLSAFLAQSASRAIVATGFLIGNLAILLLAASATAFAFLLPIYYLSFLGLIPIALGIRLLFNAHTAESSAAPVSTWSTVALVMLANSGDTLAVFAPLFAESEVFTAAGLVLGFVLATLTVLYVAQQARRNQWLSRGIEKLGPRLVPWIMIAVGIYVLTDTTTDIV